MGNINCCKRDSSIHGEMDMEAERQNNLGQVIEPIIVERHDNEKKNFLRAANQIGKPEDRSARLLEITVKVSKTIAVGTKFIIGPEGLTENSLRNKKDHITYFGYNDDETKIVEENASIDISLPPAKDSATDKNNLCIGRYFQVSYNPISKGYFLRDLGNGLGTFVNLKSHMVLRDKTLIQIGDSFLVVNLENEDLEANNTTESVEIKKKLNIRTLDGEEGINRGDYSFDPVEGKKIKIGRKGHKNDIEFFDQLISKVNCTIFYSKTEGWVIHDGNEIKKENGDIDYRSSMNGTWVLAIDDFRIYEGMIFKGHFTIFSCNFITK